MHSSKHLQWVRDTIAVLVCSTSLMQIFRKDRVFRKYLTSTPPVSKNCFSPAIVTTEGSVKLQHHDNTNKLWN